MNRLVVSAAVLVVVGLAGWFDDGDRLRLPADPADDSRFGAIVADGTAFDTRSGELPLSPSLTPVV